ncbi:hypothetical protein CXG81DRAFT_14814 [Caulochytrium protostelioides]|uniref:FCP1 homology domain-containing protein n=1 Tax=Caulochytrium protostelioides TaxID=1555241 RepID=A0A4P9WWT4_9FUNG|nr:hypothetical protein CAUPRSCDRAFT_5889 [Caulochytrium protostelioides]RKO99216.1 hypothetical protein CXG81DRAFT_14814 [Caulochytrium protostelioides]|eukprot:RKO99216.1 hypothetical protein CXG81DRAFT_14814 [Caulochytrium protostelioides]
MHTSPIWTAVRADGARPSHVDAARRALPYTAASQPSPSVQASSQRHRHSTIPPNLPPVRRRRKTLVLDLDETLIHSTARSARGYEHTIEVMLGKHVCLYFVFKRPFCDYFLQKVSSWYDVVIFTASMPEYADPVIDWLDKGRTMVQRRMFRNACTLHNGTYVKDLEQINSDLSQICLLDNSPISYALQQDNGIPIDDWTQDPNDEALLDLLPFLEALRFTDDVRSILSLRT